MENKTIVKQITNDAHNSSIGTGDCYPLIPAIPQGTDDWQRIGDKIKPKYLKVTCHGHLVADPVGGSPGITAGPQLNGVAGQVPIMVRVIAFTQNDIKAASSGANVDVGQLLRGDNGAGTYFNGYTTDLLRPVNTDKFKVLKDKKFELVPCPGHTQDGQYKLFYQFSFKVKCPATLKYDNNSVNLPNNFAPFISVGYAYVNGQSPDTVATPLSFGVTSHMVFEDA